MQKLRAVLSVFLRLPIALWLAAGLVLLSVGGIWAATTTHPTHAQVADSITATPFATDTALATSVPTLPAGTVIATDTPLPGPTNTPDPLATNTPIPLSTPTPTIVSYQAPLLPVEITLNPTSLSGTCAEGKLPEIAVTQTGGTDPIGWNAAASPRMDLNPGNSSANGDNPMVPGKPQYIGFSFGNTSLPSGTVITLTVYQTQLTVPEQTQVAGTVTVHCQ